MSNLLIVAACRFGVSDGRVRALVGARGGVAEWGSAGSSRAAAVRASTRSSRAGAACCRCSMRRIAIAPGCSELDEIADLFLTNPVANRASRAQGRAFSTTCSRVWPSPAVWRAGRAGPAGRRSRRPRSWVPCWPRSVCPPRRRATSVSTAPSAACSRRPSGSASPAATTRSACSTTRPQRCSPSPTAASALDERDLAQTAPLLDLLQASHDRLYSRLFQS